MSRWIDADDIENAKFQEKNLRGVGEHIAYRVGWNEAIEAILENALSIDIVRCKECRNLYIDTSDEGTSCYWCGVWANATDENSFCSYGKRKDEPQTEREGE